MHNATYMPPNIVDEWIPFRDALLKAQCEGDFDRVLLLLTRPGQTGLEVPWWANKSEAREKYLSGTLESAVHRAVKAADLEQVKKLFGDWTRFTKGEEGDGEVDGSDVPSNLHLPPPRRDSFVLSLAMVDALKSGNLPMLHAMIDGGVRMSDTVVRALADPGKVLDVLQGEGREREKIFTEMCEVLRKRGEWDVDSNEGLPVYLAVLHENTPFLTFLHTHGASPSNVRKHLSGCFTSSLAVAAGTKPIHFVGTLLAHGAHPDPNGLHAAIRRTTEDSERMAILQMLLEHGADVNALETGTGILPRKMGRAPPYLQMTPLYLACQRGDLYVVRLLLAHGADKDMQNQEGERDMGSPRSLAERSRNVDLRVMMLDEEREVALESKGELNMTPGQRRYGLRSMNP